MDDKEIEGLTQDEWCEYIELLSKVLDDDQDTESEDYNELS